MDKWRKAIKCTRMAVFVTSRDYILYAFSQTVWELVFILLPVLDSQIPSFYLWPIISLTYGNQEGNSTSTAWEADLEILPVSEIGASWKKHTNWNYPSSTVVEYLHRRLHILPGEKIVEASVVVILCNRSHVVCNFFF